MVIPYPTVGRWVDEQLEAQRHGALLSDDGGEVAARGVATDREPRGVDTEVGGVLGRPRRRRRRVLDGGWPWRFRRQAVVDREHGMARAVGEGAAHVLVSGDAAEHPPAAMEVDEQAEVGVIARPVEARRNAVGIDVALGVDRLRRWPGAAGP